jgi:CheY-like chemotaxis protein
VDANETSRAILGQQVSAWGMLYESTNHGHDVLKMLRSATSRGTPYACVLLDWHLPDIDSLELARAVQAEPALASVPLVLLAPAGLWGDENEARQAGIVRCLSKPVRQSGLYNCLVSVLQDAGDAAPPASPPAPSLVTDSGLAHSSILLAEDNLVNQEIAMEILTSLGCCVQVVSNGREALAALEHAIYDVILMDCQMPDLDGFATTRAIRARELAQGQAPLPIIAMTAHAMSDDRAHCLAAGMSDYLSKPFTQEQLHAVLRRWLPPPATLQAITEKSSSARGC